MVDLLEDEEEEEQSDKKEDIDGNEILDYALSRNEKISNSGTLTRNATLLEMGNGDGQEKEARTTNTNTNIIFIYFILCSLT
jgi:hypothetical protein